MITKDMETSQGQVTLRGLKRREIKELKGKGIDFGGLTAIDKLEEASEAVLGLVLPESFLEKFDDLEEAEIWRMWREVRALTYPSEEQARNLD
jgi:hypothetical protein